MICISSIHFFQKYVNRDSLRVPILLPESLVVVVLVILAAALILVILVLAVLLIVLILAVLGILRAVCTIVVLVVIHTSSFPLPSGSSDHRDKSSVCCQLQEVVCQKHPKTIHQRF